MMPFLKEKEEKSRAAAAKMMMIFRSNENPAEYAWEEK